MPWWPTPAAPSSAGTGAAARTGTRSRCRPTASCIPTAATATRTFPARDCSRSAPCWERSSTAWRARRSRSGCCAGGPAPRTAGTPTAGRAREWSLPDPDRVRPAAFLVTTDYENVDQLGDQSSQRLSEESFADFADANAGHFRRHRLEPGAPALLRHLACAHARQSGPRRADHALVRPGGQRLAAGPFPGDPRGDRGRRRARCRGRAGAANALAFVRSRFYPCAPGRALVCAARRPGELAHRGVRGGHVCSRRARVRRARGPARWRSTASLPLGAVRLWPARVVPAARLADQAGAILRAWGMSEEHVAVTVEQMLYADLRGIDSHGCCMLPFYQQLRRRGPPEPPAGIEVVQESGATALLDGGGGLGHVPAKLAMEHAIEKCHATGVGVVAVRNSGHYGAAGAYAAMAAERGLIGLATTSTPTPAVVPTFGTRADARHQPDRPGRARRRAIRPSCSTWRRAPPASASWSSGGEDGRRAAARLGARRARAAHDQRPDGCAAPAAGAARRRAGARRPQGLRPRRWRWRSCRGCCPAGRAGGAAPSARRPLLARHRSRAIPRRAAVWPAISTG